MEHPLRVDEIKGVADLKNKFLHTPIISCKRIASFRNVRSQIAPSAVVHDQEHLLAVSDEEPLVKGDNVWVGGDPFVVVYFAHGPVELMVDVVWGWDAGLIRVGDVDDFHGAADASINLGR